MAKGEERQRRWHTQRHGGGSGPQEMAGALVLGPSSKLSIESYGSRRNGVMRLRASAKPWQSCNDFLERKYENERKNARVIVNWELGGIIEGEKG